MFGNKALVKRQQRDISLDDSTYCLIPGQMKMEDYLQIVGAI